MRTILLATLVAGVVGLLGVSGASAAPVSGPSIRDAVQVTDQVTQVGWHSRYRSHWRWGSRGYYHGAHRSHWRWGSRRYWR